MEKSNFMSTLLCFLMGIQCFLCLNQATIFINNIIIGLFLLLDIQIIIAFYCEIIISIIKLLFLIFIVLNFYRLKKNEVSLGNLILLKKKVYISIGVATIVLFIINSLISISTSDIYQDRLFNELRARNFDVFLSLEQIKIIKNAINILLKTLVLILFFIVVNKIPFGSDNINE